MKQNERKDVYTYPIGENLYLNLTNRCSNDCTFCVRNGKETYEGYPLWLNGPEPTAEQVLQEIDPHRYREIVFCGFGEPTFRLDVLLKIAAEVKRAGGRTRLNTNGHGNVICGKDIAPLLKGKIDLVNISLNASCGESYRALCRPKFENAFEETVAFAGACLRAGVDCLFSVVDCIGEEEVEKCRKIANGVGIPLRVREMIE